jgi:hypothetical protein
MAASFAVVAAAVAGCGTQTIIKTVTSPAVSSNAAATTSTSANSGGSGQPQQAKIGDTLTLSGNGGEALKVTVHQVMDPLPVGSFDQPDSGQRFVGVQITLKNVGSVPYSDSPSNGATLLSNTNEQAQGQIVTGGPCGNGFQSSVKLALGDTQQGCLPFELPIGQTPSTFQFTLNSGFADQTGQWSVVGSSPAAAVSAASTNSTPTSAGGSGPLDALNSYWQSISSHDYATAYGYLVPGSVGLAESQFVSGEQQAGIKSVKFAGHVSSDDGSVATVQVDSLTTRDTQFGCRAWSGSYQMTNSGGQWLIEKASISPGPCG